MKRLVFLFCLLFGISAAAQNVHNSARYERIRELRAEADTLGMKQMLDAWGEKDPEYYAAWSNYCALMADVTTDPSWKGKAVDWVKMGREEFPEDTLLLLKLPEVLYENGQYAEALPLAEEVVQKGLDGPLDWYLLNALYSLQGNLDRAAHYLEKMSQDEDEYYRSYAEDALEQQARLRQRLDSILFVPDHTSIREIAQTADFQDLVNRFVACDTTLTREDIATVYYGSAYGKSYELADATSESIQNLVKEGKIQEAIAALQTRLEEYPVSLSLLVSLYNLSEDESVLSSCLWKVRSLLIVIDNSGNGFSPESPHHVICVNDEYQVLQQVYRARALRGQALLDKLPNGPQDQMTFVNAYGLDQDTYFYLTPPYWERLPALMP